MHSGFLKFLQHGDLILTDGDFNIAETLATHSAILKIPHFTKGKSQMSGKEVDNSRQISNVRIHVERVIGRIRKFLIVQSTIPILQVQLLDNVMSVIAALVNIKIEFSWILFPINWNLYFVERSLCFISFSTLFFIRTRKFCFSLGCSYFSDILSLNLFLFCSYFLPWFSDLPKPFISILHKATK